jgi:hypothetical protein
VERRNLDLIVDHLSLRVGGDTIGKRQTQLPMLADIVRRLCARLQARGERKYSRIANELPAIARQIGVVINQTKLNDIDQLMEEIERCIIEVGRNVRSYLAPAFLEWVHVNDPQEVDWLLSEAGFNKSQITHPQEKFLWELGQQGDPTTDLQAAIRIAKSRLILIAQNHWFMMSAEKNGSYLFWTLLSEAIVRGVDVDIVAMRAEISSSGLPISGNDPDEPDAVALWSLYMGAPQFPRQIDECWMRFAEWDRMYKELSDSTDICLGNLRIFGAYFVPFTMTIIDPDIEDGYLVLSPRTPNNKSVSRPQFMIKKNKEPYAFNYYYGDVQFQLVNEVWVKIFG